MNLSRVSKALAAGFASAAGTTYLTLPNGADLSDLAVLAVNFSIGFAITYLAPANA